MKPLPPRLTVLFMIGLPWAAAAQYSIPWSRTGGGGGTSTGGVYSVTGTVGQHDAGGAASHGAYSLTGGFWSCLQVVHTPGAPVLQLIPSPTNTVVVSWPSPSTGFDLQQATDLGLGDWVAGPDPTDDGVAKRVVIESPTGVRFFRLLKR